MTFYQELQLNQAGSKNLLKKSETLKEKLYHMWVYLVKIAATMAFCFFFVSIFSILFGNENSIVGVVVLLCLMVFRNADLGIHTGQSTMLLALFFVIMTVCPHLANQFSPVLGMLLNIAALAVLILFNVDSVPYFFKAVFEGAFKPEAVFGGFLGTALLQGVKRGLMSNEAGQGTITMAAASAEARHPCEQGIISALGVFLDTHVICTMTGFIIVMAHEWALDPAAWKAAGTYGKFLFSVNGLAPEMLQVMVQIMVSICFCLFAYTCVIGFVSFSEISANRISSSKGFINFIRCLCVFVAAFGIACNIAGYDLSNLWAFSDLGNIIMVYCNVPMLYLGLKYVIRAARHYSDGHRDSFESEKVLGIRTAYWNGEEK